MNRPRTHMKHAFSVDVEDWYQGVELPVDHWERFAPRIRRGMDPLLDLMAEHGVRSTCFVLGKVAEEHPDLVREIHAAGHEVATHGWAHRRVYDLTPTDFRKRLRRSIDVLETITGEAVIGYRAPYFTITERSRWALGILAEEGLSYDASIQPSPHYRSGFSNEERLPSLLHPGSAERTLLEIPVSTFPIMGANLPVGGGAYMRLCPRALWLAALQRLAKRGERLSLYIHPWELDLDHPRIPLPFPTSFTHYVNLASTRSKLSCIFREFDFVPYRDAYCEDLPKAANTSVRQEAMDEY